MGLATVVAVASSIPLSPAIPSGVSSGGTSINYIDLLKQAPLEGFSSCQINTIGVLSSISWPSRY